MNTVPEFVALHRRDYSEVDRNTLASEADQIRDTSLRDLKFCAETFKHVRKINVSRNQGTRFETVATSTGGSTGDPTTWAIGQYDPVAVLQRAFSTLAALPELK